MSIKLNAKQLLLRHVVKLQNGCWEWKGAKDRNGYGIVCRKVDGKPRTMVAHKASFLAFRGPVPDECELHHTCKRRSCVNPQHVEPVTREKHLMLDESCIGVNARKTHCPNGHPLVEGNLVLVQLRRKRRECLTCHKARKAESYKRNAERLREKTRERYWASR